MRAAVTADKKHVMIKGELWSDVIPVDRLDGWIAFYDRLAKKPGRAKVYQPTADALRSARARLLGNRT